MPTPYSQHVGDRDPVAVLRDSFEDYRRLEGKLGESWSEPLGPGKWTVRQVVVHVTQWEMILGMRFRFALAQPGFLVQTFDQDPLMGEADVVDGPTAFAAFEALRRMNLAFANSLTPSQRRQPARHPDRGEIDVEDLLITLAGHGVHHFKQLQAALEEVRS